MFRNNCCPALSVKTFSAIITFVNIAAFITTLVVGGINISGDFLAPELATLVEFGANYPYAMQQ
jgi:hypothetical protein